MSVLSAPSSPKAESQAAVPARSPRTSIVLAELARQRRYERRRRRLRRQQRRRTWARRMAWLAAFGRKPLELVRTNAAPCLLLFAGIMPLLDILTR
jgi:hypothetical protein